jgi:beta-glucosidase/6-phospho-beta-glucosidase/beta-galactosidase
MDVNRMWNSIEGEEKYKDNNGVIQDFYRIDYFKEHLAWLLKAINEGTNCKGFMIWNWMDNISPYNSLKNRYGLVEMDLNNDRSRRIKKSDQRFKESHDTREFEFDEIENKYK